MRVKLLIGEVGKQVVVGRDMTIAGYCSYAKLVPCCVVDPSRDEIRYEIRKYEKDEFFDEYETDIKYIGAVPEINLSDRHYIVGEMIETKCYDKLLKALFEGGVEESIIGKALSDYNTVLSRSLAGQLGINRDQEVFAMTNEITCLEKEAVYNDNGVFTLPALLDLLFNRLKIVSLRLVIRKNVTSIRVVTMGGRSLDATIEVKRRIKIA